MTAHSVYRRTLRTDFRPLIVAVTMALALASCTRTQEATPATLSGQATRDLDSLARPVVAYDTALVLWHVFTDVYGASAYFTFDQAHNRYSSIEGITPHSYDSTYIDYNDDGTVSDFVQAVDHELVKVTVIVYNDRKQISKVVTKIQEPWYGHSYDPQSTRDISDISRLDYYDSLNYDSKNRISSSFRRQYPLSGNPISYAYFSRIFRYRMDNDSLLDRIDEYNMDAGGNSYLRGSYIYYSYDTQINPFYKVCPIYGLIDHATAFYSQAASGDNNYKGDHFLNFGPHNATSSSEDGSVSYRYNADHLPIYCSYSWISTYKLYSTEMQYVKVAVKK